MDAYLLYCAIEDSPLLPRAANEEANENFARITKEGRKPGLTLARDGREVPMQGWADSLLDNIEPVAQALDALHGIDEHMTALKAQRARLADVSLTPSARVLETMREKHQSFNEFALELSAKHADYFRGRPLSAEAEREMAALATKSLDDQARIEREEVGSFDAFVGAYRAYTLNRISV